MPEITEEEYAAATVSLKQMGVRGHHDDGVAKVLATFLGHSLEFIFMEFPEDEKIRAALAAYRAWIRLPDHAGEPDPVPTDAQLEQVITHLQEMV